MNAILTFSGAAIFAAFTKENRAKFGDFSPRFDELIKAINLLNASCCGAIKDKRAKDADAVYRAIVGEIKKDTKFAESIKEVSASAILRFESGGILIEEI